MKDTCNNFKRVLIFVHIFFKFLAVKKMVKRKISHVIKSSNWDKTDRIMKEMVIEIERCYASRLANKMSEEYG